MQETEPLQGLLAAVMQGQHGSNPCAQGLPDADAGRQFADRVGQDLPEAVLVAAEKILLGAEVAEEGALGDAGLPGDLGDGRLVVALLDEQAQGSQNLRTGRADGCRSTGPWSWIHRSSQCVEDEVGGSGRSVGYRYAPLPERDVPDQPKQRNSETVAGDSPVGRHFQEAHVGLALRAQADDALEATSCAQLRDHRVIGSQDLGGALELHGHRRSGRVFPDRYADGHSRVFSDVADLDRVLVHEQVEVEADRRVHDADRMRAMIYRGRREHAEGLLRQGSLDDGELLRRVERSFGG